MKIVKHLLSFILLSLTIKYSFAQNSNKATELNYQKETPYDWQKKQDSIRNVLLKSKENEVLKNSFLQELYIKDVLTYANDSLTFNINFNLHGADCGAPDCFSTDIHFSFQMKNKLIFPKDIWITEHEHGCVDKEYILKAKFILIEQSEKYIIYHSAKLKRTLVLLRNYKEFGTTALYFTNVTQEKIIGKNINQLMDISSPTYNESDYPFTSSTLSTNEYELFLK